MCRAQRLESRGKPVRWRRFGEAELPGVEADALLPTATAAVDEALGRQCVEHFVDQHRTAETGGPIVEPDDTLGKRRHTGRQPVTLPRGEIG